MGVEPTNETARRPDGSAGVDRLFVIVNHNPYGKGPAVFTRSGAAARRFENEIQVGMNVPIPVPMAFFSFSGWKSSLFVDLHIHGVEGVKLLHTHQGHHHSLARAEGRSQPVDAGDEVNRRRSRTPYRKVTI